MSWETDTGPVRRDPASSGVVVVRHGGQVGLRGDSQMIACMPYPAMLSETVAELGGSSAESTSGRCRPSSLVSAAGVGHLPSTGVGLALCREASLRGPSS